MTKHMRNAMARMGWLTKERICLSHLRAIKRYCESGKTTVTYTGQM